VCYYAQIENESFPPDHPEIRKAIDYHAIKRNGQYRVSNEVVSDTVSDRRETGSKAGPVGV
jgi:hypothetical protein